MDVVDQESVYHEEDEGMFEGTISNNYDCYNRGKIIDWNLSNVWKVSVWSLVCPIIKKGFNCTGLLRT